jgi:ABC-2 type transport system permease protein
MRILDLAAKDLRQIFADRKVALLIVAMPILFTAFFGMLFGGSGTQGDSRLPVGLVNRDPSSSVGPALFTLLEASDSVRPVALGEKEANAAALKVRDGKIAAAVTVPAGFGQAIWSVLDPAFLAGDDQDARLLVIVDEGSPSGLTASNAIDTAAARLLGALQSAKLSAAAYEAQAAFADAAARQAYIDQAIALASTAWKAPPLALVAEKAGATPQKSQPDAYDQASPGLLVQFTIWSLIMSAGVIVLERKSGAMQRLLTTPTRAWQIIAGHALAMFLLTLAQELILLTFGQFALGVDYLRQPIAILLVALAMALWVVSLGMLIGAISRDDSQSLIWSLMAMFVFTGLGGAWFPLEGTGKAFQTIGRLMPSQWAMRGFQNIIVRGQGIQSVWLPVGILLVYALAFFALAVWRFRFE